MNKESLLPPAGSEDQSTSNMPRTSCSNLSKNPYYNICLLAGAWALTLTTSTLLTTLGPLSAISLGASNSLAAFTIGAFLIGAAFSSVPSGWLFRNYGRLIVFLLGCFFQIVGSVFCSLSMVTEDLLMLYFGCFAIGLGQGIGQFYRFSAVEVAPTNLKSRAVTYVLSGGVFAAFLGPTIANRGKDLLTTEFLGSYVIIAAIAVVNIVVVLFVHFPSVSTMKIKTPARSQQNSKDYDCVSDLHSSIIAVAKIRSTKQIVTQPLFIISCAVATLAHTIMVMIMSNVTIDMLDHNFGFETCALVMEVHFFAMFVPGFFSGMLIEKQGTFVVSLIGGLIFAVSSFVLTIDDQDYNFMLGMVLVGVAWNLAFSAGTIMLTHCYKPAEATEVQAVNDFILFTIAGGGSLASGYIYSGYGWLALILVCSGLMLAYLLLFTFIWFFAVSTVADEEKSLLGMAVDNDPLSLENAFHKHSGEEPVPRRVISSESADHNRGQHSRASFDIVRGTARAGARAGSDGRGSRSGSGNDNVASRLFGSMSSPHHSRPGSFSGNNNNNPRGSSFTYEQVPRDHDNETQTQIRSMSVV